MKTKTHFCASVTWVGYLPERDKVFSRLARKHRGALTGSGYDLLMNERDVGFAFRSREAAGNFVKDARSAAKEGGFRARVRMWKD